MNNLMKKALLVGAVAGLPFAAAADNIAVAVGINMDDQRVENFAGAAGIGESAVASASAGSVIFTESVTASAGAANMTNAISGGAIGSGGDHSSYVNIAGQVSDELIAAWVCDNWEGLTGDFTGDEMTRTVDLGWLGDVTLNLGTPGGGVTVDGGFTATCA